jgi:hypothetical protein
MFPRFFGRPSVHRSIVRASFFVLLVVTLTAASPGWTAVGIVEFPAENDGAWRDAHGDTADLLALDGLNSNAIDCEFTLAPEPLGQQVTELAYRYCQPPTPSRNNDTGFTGLVADTKFDMNRGFYFRRYTS